MAKRFTDTDIWEQDWFIDLPNKYKLFWNFLKDKCDNVGIWRPNKGIAQRIIGEPINLDEFLTFINIEKIRVLVLPTGRWFIKDFFVFQYGDKFSPTSSVHKGALKALLQNGIHPKEILGNSIGKLQDLDIQQLKEIAYHKDIDNLNIAFGNPSIRVKDKDKDKDKDKNKENNKYSTNSNYSYGKKFPKFDTIDGQAPKAIRIDSENAYFADGTIQPLGKMQKELNEIGRLKPSDVALTLIN